MIEIGTGSVSVRSVPSTSQAPSGLVCSIPAILEYSGQTGRVYGFQQAQFRPTLARGKDRRNNRS